MKPMKPIRSGPEGALIYETPGNAGKLFEVIVEDVEVWFEGVSADDEKYGPGEPYFGNWGSEYLKRGQVFLSLGEIWVSQHSRRPWERPKKICRWRKIFVTEGLDNLGENKVWVRSACLRRVAT